LLSRIKLTNRVRIYPDPYDKQAPSSYPTSSSAIAFLFLLPQTLFACEVTTPLDQIPLYLQRAVVLSEDRGFFQHGGNDLSAILRATWQNLRAMRVVSGASTITEQLVKLEYKLPRTFSGRLKAALFARSMERQLSKDQILERYLNCVPYPAGALGVRGGARVLFGRDLSTLNEKEMLALAVMIRAPGALDPLRNERGLERRITRLARNFPESERVLAQSLQIIPREEGFLRTTKIEERPRNERLRSLLEERLRLLASANVQDGALLAIRNDTGQPIVWEWISKTSPAIDSVNVPRQAGSTLKPFLYALLLDRGVSADSIVIDAPLRLSVNNGVQAIKNYSGEFYGEVTIREALGSSLNTPAVRVLEVVGQEFFFSTLRRLGFESLTRESAHYGEGIVIGNGEVTLRELVQAYRLLATGGGGIFSLVAAEEITRILSDPDVRRFEFGVGGLLQFPEQTAVKTGTSNDHHDAWAIGYSPEFTVGVWMGNLDRTPMREVSGSRGPAWVLRAAFNELRVSRDREMSWRGAETRARHAATGLPKQSLKIVYPLDGIEIKRDKRIAKEGVMFELSGDEPATWVLNGKKLGVGGQILWYLEDGEHLLQAQLQGEEIAPVRFRVR
jgi:penicillin-binding protein 1C